MFNKFVFLQGLTPKTQMEDVHTHEAEAHAAGSAGLLLRGWARFSPLFFSDMILFPERKKSRPLFLLPVPVPAGAGLVWSGSLQ
jgi:hypothetical protein